MLGLDEFLLKIDGEYCSIGAYSAQEQQKPANPFVLDMKFA